MSQEQVTKNEKYISYYQGFNIVILLDGNNCTCSNQDVFSRNDLLDLFDYDLKRLKVHMKQHNIYTYDTSFFNFHYLKKYGVNVTIRSKRHIENLDLISLLKNDGSVKIDKYISVGQNILKMLLSGFFDKDNKYELENVQNEINKKIESLKNKCFKTTL